MSRRKQPKPRHIETDDELASLLQNESESRSPSNSSNPADDAHVCGKCREEFLGLAEFLAHKKTCSRKRLVLVCNESENNLMNEENLDVNYNPKVPKLIDQYEYPCIGSDAEDEEEDDDMDNFDDDENEIMDAEDREIANEEIDEDLIKISMMNAAANGMTDEEDEVNDDDDDDDNDGDDNNNEKRHDNYDEMSEKYGDGSKRDKSSHPHPAMFPFSQALPSSNVTLEPMMATRAAVAQFAENNALPSDVSMLQTTLYSLQQQQLVQLQLIHQLQQQIIMGTNPPMIPNGALPLMPPLSSSSGKLGSHSQDSAVDKSSKEKKDTELSKSEQLSGADIKSELETLATMSSTSSMLSGTSAIPSALPLPSNNMMTPSAQPSEFAKLTKQEVEGGKDARISHNTIVERSQYVSEDPFFRHKCRLCHKVFGSDSALQIHIRSHTGERPFKCNICGNRFTTRGNLKVHFERHKAKYPHVKMNPHPVPEHLDKMPPMPIIGSPFPSSAPVHPPLPSGIMNSTAPMSIAPMMSSMYSRMVFTPKQTDVRTTPSEEQNLPSPASSTNTPVTSPTPTASEAPASKSPNVSDTASLAASSESTSTAAVTSKAESSPSQRFTSPLMSSLPQVTPASSYPLLSPLPSAPPPLTPTVPVGSTSRDSILPSKMIDQDENLEKYMEIDRSSETSKLQQLVDNLENKVSDPNQCVICHRVLSCKSALQMHYRIHTGERPYKCKICRRAFTTKGNLKTHMGVHRMKPPIRMMHQCPVCHKSFTNLLVLQQHIRSHATPPGIPPLPDMTHFNAMHNFPPPMDWSRPYDLSFRRYPDKELDLSRSSSVFHSRRMNNEMNDADDVEDQYGDDEESMDIDGDMTEIKEETEVNYKNEENPSGDSGAGSEEGHHSSIDEEEKKESRDERPNSAVSEVSRDSGRSPSPNSENDTSPATDAAHTYPSLANSSSVSTYNTSLAALEERVRAIDSSMLQSPMNRFNPFMLNGFQPPISNGDHNPLMKSPNMPYGSESGSDGNVTGDDESKPGTPALSINSDGGSSIMSGLRDGDKSTTCNICLKAFACRSALDIHYRSHTKERPFKCGACDRSFSTKGNMKQHMLTHKIRDLPNSFNTNSNSSASHENNNSNDSVSDEKKDDVHVTPESTPPASNNDSSSSRHSNGIGQNTSNGGDVSPFLRRTPLKHQCQVCQKGFSSASALQIHIRTHTGDKPFKCNVCGKAFTTKGNLKVHMGTHMWNNSPSRRGRRMSIEPPFMLAHKENPYMTGFPHRSTPDFFPFQFPPFMNGVPPHKMNEISVIQSLSGGMGHLPAMSLSSDHMMSPRSKGVDSSENKSDSWRKSDTNGNVTSTGELDLSMKSSSSSSPNNNNKRSPSGDTWNSAWKTMCHLCNQNFPSPTALDNHMQNFHLKGGESHSKSLVA